MNNEVNNGKFLLITTWFICIYNSKNAMVFTFSFRPKCTGIRRARVSLLGHLQTPLILKIPESYLKMYRCTKGGNFSMLIFFWNFIELEIGYKKNIKKKISNKDGT